MAARWKYVTRIAGPWLISLLISTQAAAQLAGALTGTVQDSASRQPVAYATVALLASPARAVAGTITDAQGRFALTGLAAGSFRLRVSFVGYTTRTRAVTITAGPTALPPLLLGPAAQQLAEAVVVGAAPLVEVGPDRFIYHAGRDAANAGGTAPDVLRKTPLLAVDGAGNLTLRGSPNFKILLNGQPAPAFAQNLTQALKGLPASQIERVEVVTTPAARDDGEGTAGLINIVLKKAQEPGLSARLGASGGNRAGELTSALSWGRGKVGVRLAASAGRWLEPDELTRRRLGFSPLGPDTLTQSGPRRNTGTWYNAALDFDYDPAPRHHLALRGALGGYRAQGQQVLLSRLATPNAANQLFTRALTEYTGSTSPELTGTYVRTFARARREWSVLGQYAGSAGTFGYDADQYDRATRALGSPDYRERSRGRTPGREITAQTDFTQPLGAKSTLQAGLKVIFRRVGAVADVAGATPGPAPDFAPLPGRGTDFDYRQAVQAAYLSYGGGVGKLTATLGSRVERTALAADFRASGTALPPRQYYAWLPTGSLNYALSDTSSLRLAYGRRITRPYIDYLNPFVDRSNPQNTTYGNPALNPELTNAYELTYGTRVRGATVVASGAVRHTGGAIEAVRLPTAAPGVTAQTFANVATETTTQLILYATARPAPRWEVSGGPNGQYVVRLSPELELVRRGFTAGLSVDTTYRFARQLTVQASAAAALPAPTLQGRGAANLYYAVSARKTLLADRADLTLHLANPFTNSLPYRSSVATAFADERTEYRAYQRAFRLSFNYRLGQEGPERTRKKVDNDDLKGGR